MTASDSETIPGLILKNIPRDVVMGVEEALTVGAQRAYAGARGMDDGHLPHVVGQLRHFHMNELFQRALAMGGISTSLIRGNGIVTGRSGIFTVARFNIPEGYWINGRRSNTRRQLSMANRSIEPLVQPDLFDDYTPASEAVIFFVACFSRGKKNIPETPVSIQIAVPDKEMRDWLFRESLDAFINRYSQESAPQHDLAIPKLKKNIGKQDKDGTTQ